ncbi:hypothetical protein AV656_01200 [Bhargavaea cecembensis]|uniref:DUF421 domain-containing protein n=1 Tax=Bhargavaea cecembensis TaxID=394098 RepID=A0A163G9L1_9BACL|nr:YetF domain-containing protein [Bhargavaea cecembensis]KZE39926.1 hypothetical protein AV656_01200 [Bhargavaea cecembensis]
MFFDSWEAIGNIMVTGVISYVLLIIFLRVSGKRALSKMNMFDFVVTIALGSLLATILLDNNTPLLNGITAVGLLLLLQFIVSWLTVRWEAARNLIKGSPEALYENGTFREEAMRRTRVHRTEMLQSVRERGVASLEQVEAIVLESNGDISVVKKTTRSMWRMHSMM